MYYLILFLFLSSCVDKPLGSGSGGFIKSANTLIIPELELNDGAYRFDNNTYAKSCLAYLNSAGYNSEGDGLYWIDSDEDGARIEVKALCDMTRNGGGWTLIANRRGSATNNEACGANLSDFFSNICGDVDNIGYTNSYSIGDGDERERIVSEGEWMFLQYDVSDTLDSDDAFIIRNDGSDLFFSSTGTLNRTLVTSVCDINNTNCDSSDVNFMWVGNGWWGSANCASGFSTGAYVGNYGYCQNGVASYLSNGLFGNRSGYSEAKLWAHTNGARVYQERIWAR